MNYESNKSCSSYSEFQRDKEFNDSYKEFEKDFNEFFVSNDDLLKSFFDKDPGYSYPITDSVNLLREDVEMDSLKPSVDIYTRKYFNFYSVLIYFFSNKIHETSDLNLQKLMKLDKEVLQEEIMILFSRMGRLRKCANDWIHNSNKISYRIDFNDFYDLNKKVITDRDMIKSFIEKEYDVFFSDKNEKINLFYVINQLI